MERELLDLSLLAFSKRAFVKAVFSKPADKGEVKTVVTPPKNRYAICSLYFLNNSFNPITCSQHTTPVLFSLPRRDCQIIFDLFG